MTISAGLRRAVSQRAGDRCEYCGLAQAAQEALFHVDHITPRVAKGPTVLENLGLACVSCSLRKGARLAATDPDTGLAADLFNPRRDRWQDHFGLHGFRILGLTPSGRATVSALSMNRPLALAIRREEMLRGRYPGGP